jgi:hypothetical protein
MQRRCPIVEGVPRRQEYRRSDPRSSLRSLVNESRFQFLSQGTVVGARVQRAFSLGVLTIEGQL